MNHFTNADFRDACRKLPQDVRALADKSFVLLKQDARHPSLQLKKVGPYWSARIGLHYRAVAVPAEDGLL